ncbi:MAG: hypothetical protein N3F05_01220 [Candidatus Diapherotrites archaeon]|nr:hypothetical protein [Candidatus Diapherotrites archaeon]
MAKKQVKVKKLEKGIFVANTNEDKEHNSKVACELLSIYFKEIASRSIKRQLALSDLVKAYKFTLKLLEEQTQKDFETEPKNVENATNDKLMQIKAAVEKPAQAEKPYVHINSKGEIYYLQRKGNFYFFSRSPEGAVPLPTGYKIHENRRTGMPIIRKE